MKEEYKYIISDVAMEISIDSYWRNKIFKLKEHEKLKIEYDDDKIPSYVKKYILNNKLSFYVEIVSECEEDYDKGLVIFKFTAAEYSDIYAFSGNNPDII